MHLAISQYLFEIAAFWFHQRYIITGPFMTDHYISIASRPMGLLFLANLVLWLELALSAKIVFPRLNRMYDLSEDARS